MQLNAIEQCYQELKAEGKTPLRLFSGNPADFGTTFPNELLRGIFADSLSTAYDPDPQGWIGARQTIADYYADRGMGIDPAHIILTSGTSDTFRYLCDLLATPGDHVLLPSPGYPLFSEIARHNHLLCDYYQLRRAIRWEMDIASIEAGITPKTKAIVIVSPHNPTGMVASRHELESVTEIANHYQIPLIVDEVFSEFYYGDGDYPRLMTVTKPYLCFTMNGISKMFALPGLKCGWLIVSGDSKQVCESVERLSFISDMFLSVNSPIQKALPALFKRGLAFTRHYAATLSKHRAILLESLAHHPHLSITAPEGGFYAMIQVENRKWQNEDEMICDIMKQHNLFFHPGYFYEYEHGLNLVMTLLVDTRIIQTVSCY